MNDKNISNLTEEIKELKEVIIELNKNLKDYNDNNRSGYIIDWSENELNKLDDIKEIDNKLEEQIELSKYFSSLGKNINIDTDNETKEMIEICKQMIPIFKEWIKEHKKGDEWKNE